MIRVFLDTNIFVHAVFPGAPTHTDCLRIICQMKIPCYTNEYVLKEFRRVLVMDYACRSEKVERAIDYLRTKCTVLRTPAKEELLPIKISDRADRPMVVSALKAGCILISDDRRLVRDARAYVDSFTAPEFIRSLSLVLAKPTAEPLGFLTTNGE